MCYAMWHSVLYACGCYKNEKVYLDAIEPCADRRDREAKVKAGEMSDEEFNTWLAEEHGAPIEWEMTSEQLLENCSDPDCPSQS